MDDSKDTPVEWLAAPLHDLPDPQNLENDEIKEPDVTTEAQASEPIEKALITKQIEAFINTLNSKILLNDTSEQSLDMQAYLDSNDESVEEDPEEEEAAREVYDIYEINDNELDSLSKSLKAESFSDFNFYTILGYKYSYSGEVKNLVKDESYYKPPTIMCQNFTSSEQSLMPVKVMSDRYRYNKRLMLFDACSNRAFNREGKRLCQLRKNMQLCSGYVPLPEKITQEIVNEAGVKKGTIGSLITSNGIKIYKFTLGDDIVNTSLELESTLKYININHPELAIAHPDPSSDGQETEYSGYCKALVNG